MKINKVEMEFICFDAKDVIMVSPVGLTEYYGLKSDKSHNISYEKFADGENETVPGSLLKQFNSDFAEGFDYELATSSVSGSNADFVITGIKRADDFAEFIYTPKDASFAKNLNEESNLYVDSSTTNWADVVTWLIANQAYLK